MSQKTTGGTFPSKWHLKQLGDLFHAKAGGDIVQSRSNDVQNDRYPYPIYANSRDQQGLYGFCSYAEEPAGSITVIGRGASLGKAFYRNTPFVAIGRLIVLRPKASIDTRFFCEYINYGIAFAVESTGIPQLTIPQISNYLLPIPPEPEQHAIAEALSDVDGLVNALDALIAKKRAIKQATMQQLLTGKTRLPGFSGAWETKQLGEIFTIFAGSSKSQYITQGGKYIVVDMGSVATDGQLIVSKFTDYEGDFLKEGDLVMPKDDIGGGKIIGKVAYIDANNLYVLGDHVYALRLIEGLPKFFFYLINRYETNSSLKSKVGGSAQLGLSRKAVVEQEIPIPTYEEQNAIASVLSDMDAEITALEQRRGKTRAIKQGMMQQLLTGRVRLVKSDVTSAIR